MGHYIKILNHYVNKTGECLYPLFFLTKILGKHSNRNEKMGELKFLQNIKIFCSNKF